MIDYQETFRMYTKWLAWPHCKEVDGELCQYYQQFRFYTDEIMEKEERNISGFVNTGLFYILIIPILLLIWVICVGIMNIYHRIRK